MLNNKINHMQYTAFGGEIYKRDFDAHLTMSDIASRIAADQRFEKTCRQNENFRKLRNNTNSERM